MANTGKTSKNHSGVWTAVICIILLLVLLGIVALVVNLVRGEDTPADTDTPVYTDTGSLVVSIEGERITSGTSIGLVTLGQEITVEGVDDYSIAVYAYSSATNDFTFTVDGSPITWGEANGRNITAGFDIEYTDSGFTISYGGIGTIISRAQGGAIVTTNAVPEDTDLFRLTVLADDGRVDMYFHVVHFFDIVLDITEVII